jgi:hypothetical protein
MHGDFRGRLPNESLFLSIRLFGRWLLLANGSLWQTVFARL